MPLQISPIPAVLAAIFFWDKWKRCRNYPKGPLYKSSLAACLDISRWQNLGSSSVPLGSLLGIMSLVWWNLWKPWCGHVHHHPQGAKHGQAPMATPSGNQTWQWTSSPFKNVHRTIACQSTGIMVCCQVNPAETWPRLPRLQNGQGIFPKASLPTGADQGAVSDDISIQLQLLQGEEQPKIRRPTTQHNPNVRGGQRPNN